MIEFTGKELDSFLRKIKKERSGECYVTSNSREKMMSSKLFEDGLINLQEIDNRLVFRETPHKIVHKPMQGIVQHQTHNLQIDLL